MNTLDWILLAIAAGLLIVVLVGVRISRRQQAAREQRLQQRLGAANEALAQAHALDNGWDRETLEAAARAAHGGPVDSLHLVQVVDNPGTDADEAVFQVKAAGHTHEVRLGRVDGEWVAR